MKNKVVASVYALARTTTVSIKDNWIRVDIPIQEGSLPNGDIVGVVLPLYATLTGGKLATLRRKLAGELDIAPHTFYRKEKQTPRRQPLCFSKLELEKIAEYLQKAGMSLPDGLAVS